MYGHLYRTTTLYGDGSLFLGCAVSGGCAAGEAVAQDVLADLAGRGLGQLGDHLTRLGTMNRGMRPDTKPISSPGSTAAFALATTNTATSSSPRSEGNATAADSSTAGGR